MTIEGSASASYAAEVARLLWPEPWGAPSVTRDRHRDGTAHRNAYLFPSEQRPRLLVPADLPRSAVMVRTLGSSRSAFVRPARAVLERSVGSRAFPLVRWPMLSVPGVDPRADSIERYLGQRLGVDVRVGILLGTRRVNQKPVLQLFDRDGGTVLGYAKVGHNALTAALVRREAEALATVASHGPRSFTTPRVLHHGRWGDLEVLVVSPLTPRARDKVAGAVRLAASRELAQLAGCTTTTLAESPYLARLTTAASRLPDTTAARRVGAAVAAVGARLGGATLTFGGWHGDWGHWNMGLSQGRLQVWDWERYDAGVPVGFDPLHFAAQHVRPGDRAAARQEAAFLRSVPAMLTEMGVAPDRHEATLLLYLAEISERYLEALQHGATPALQRRTSWVLSLLDRRLAQIPSGPRGRP